MWVSKKINNKESMICLKPKKFLKWLEFLYGLHQSQTLTIQITLYGEF